MSIAAFSGLRAFALSRSWFVSTFVFLLSMVTFGLNVVSDFILIVNASLNNIFAAFYVEFGNNGCEHP